MPVADVPAEYGPLPAEHMESIQVILGEPMPA